MDRNADRNRKLPAIERVRAENAARVAAGAGVVDQLQGSCFVRDERLEVVGIEILAAVCPPPA